MEKFKLVSQFTLQGDQPQAVAQLLDGLRGTARYQTLLGVTGSGKTYTMQYNAIYGRPIWRFRTIKRWPLSCTANCAIFFPTMRWNILSVIMITISRRRIFRAPIPY